MRRLGHEIAALQCGKALRILDKAQIVDGHDGRHIEQPRHHKGHAVRQREAVAPRCNRPHGLFPSNPCQPFLGGQRRSRQPHAGPDTQTVRAARVDGIVFVILLRQVTEDLIDVLMNTRPAITRLTGKKVGVNADMHLFIRPWRAARGHARVTRSLSHITSRHKLRSFNQLYDQRTIRHFGSFPACVKNTPGGTCHLVACLPL